MTISHPTNLNAMHKRWDTLRMRFQTLAQMVHDLIREAEQLCQQTPAAPSSALSASGSPSDTTSQNIPSLIESSATRTHSHTKKAPALPMNAAVRKQLRVAQDQGPVASKQQKYVTPPSSRPTGSELPSGRYFTVLWDGEPRPLAEAEIPNWLLHPPAHVTLVRDHRGVRILVRQASHSIKRRPLDESFFLVAQRIFRQPGVPFGHATLQPQSLHTVKAKQAARRLSQIICGITHAIQPGQGTKGPFLSTLAVDDTVSVTRRGYVLSREFHYAILDLRAILSTA